MSLAYCEEIVSQEVTNSVENKENELKEIESSLSAIKKWQGKYLRQMKFYHQKANRIQFKNAHEAKKLRTLSQNAQENSDVLQDQINMLSSRKKELLSNLE